MKKLCLLLTTLSMTFSSLTAFAFDETEYQNRLDEISTLLSECDAGNIPTDYEKAAYIVLSRFKEYVVSDIENGYPESQIQYNEDALDRIYSDTKNSLERYLDGSAVPVDVPVRGNVADRKISGKNK